MGQLYVLLMYLIIIREYDTSIHPDIPQQTKEVLTNKTRNKGFNANHDRAVSFTLGQGSSDWGSLTLFVLTANGEVYGLCPYIPRHA
jgi:nucleoporin NUP82